MLNTLEKITGIKRAEMDEIFQAVKANQAKLDSCDLHDFSVEHKKIGQFVRDWQCSKCGGHVESAYKRWYERGLAHAKT